MSTSSVTAASAVSTPKPNDAGQSSTVTKTASRSAFKVLYWLMILASVGVAIALHLKNERTLSDTMDASHLFANAVAAAVTLAMGTILRKNDAADAIPTMCTYCYGLFVPALMHFYQTSRRRQPPPGSDEEPPPLSMRVQYVYRDMLLYCFHAVVLFCICATNERQSMGKEDEKDGTATTMRTANYEIAFASMNAICLFLYLDRFRNKFVFYDTVRQNAWSPAAGNQDHVLPERHPIPMYVMYALMGLALALYATNAMKRSIEINHGVYFFLVVHIVLFTIAGIVSRFHLDGDWLKDTDKLHGFGTLSNDTLRAYKNSGYFLNSLRLVLGLVGMVMYFKVERKWRVRSARDIWNGALGTARLKKNE